MITETTLPVAPATPSPTRVTIHVTQEDIDLGRRGRSDSCMVARALMRTFEQPLHELAVTPPPGSDGDGIYVGKWPACGVSLLLLPSGHFVRTPPFAAEQIHRFDTGAKVEPFSFELELPEAAA